MGNGTIRVECDEYIGIASDGVVVALGSNHAKPSLLWYLLACPEPKNW